MTLVRAAVVLARILVVAAFMDGSSVRRFVLKYMQQIQKRLLAANGGVP